MKHTNGMTAKVQDLVTLERTRYFPRQLISSVEMTLEQDYFRAKLRRHNRFFHGWGVLCGAEVCAVRTRDGNGWEPWKVRVQPGYALAPSGEEIVIGKERVLDLRINIATGEPQGSGGEMLDPWCKPVYQENLPEWVYVAVRYHEMMTRQVRVQPAGCGCDDSSCEYSRICDGYEFGILPNCPPSHQNPPDMGDLGSLLSFPEACFEYPDEDWVVLAAVRIEQSGRILAIDNCSCRRMVASFAGVWTRCATGGLVVHKLDPSELEQAHGYDVTVAGENFQPGIKSELGPWAAISRQEYISSGEIRFHVDVSSNAPIGNHTLMLMNPDCGLAVTSVLVTEKPANTDVAKPADTPEKEKRKRGTRR